MTLDFLLQGRRGYRVLENRALWKLKGSDRIRYLNGQVTNDVAKLSAGESCYAGVCTAKGKLVSDLFVGADQDQLWLDAPLERREILRERLEKFLIADDAEFEDLTETHCLTHYFGADLPQVDGVVLKNARFGIPGCDVWNVKGKSFQAGEEVSDSVLEELQIEKLIPKWGSELSEEILPPEAGMDRQGIRYDKGCYVGQEVMARIKSIGHVNKVLCKLESSDPLISGGELMEGVQRVGRVTRSVRSSRNGRGIGLGYVSWKMATPGRGLEASGIALTISETALT